MSSSRIRKQAYTGARTLSVYILYNIFHETCVCFCVCEVELSKAVLPPISRSRLLARALYLAHVMPKTGFFRKFHYAIHNNINMFCRPYYYIMMYYIIQCLIHNNVEGATDHWSECNYMNSQVFACLIGILY